MEEQREIKGLIWEELYADTEPPDQDGGVEKALRPPTERLPAPSAPVMEPAVSMTEDAPVQLEKAAPLPDEAVTRHTTALWKYQPVPEEEPEPFPEYLTRETEIPGAGSSPPASGEKAQA